MQQKMLPASFREESALVHGQLRCRQRNQGRQRKLPQVASGRSNKEVAAQLGISIKTAENHRHRLMTKLDARNAADLTRVAFELELWWWAAALPPRLARAREIHSRAPVPVALR